MAGKKTAKILPTDTKERFDAAVRAAADLLRKGETVALPTETVYGLAANAYNPAAVARIFEIKGRPSHNPIIVHVASLELARECAAAWTESAAKVARAFWPGPLTIVLPRSGKIPDNVTASGSTVGIRWPSHPFTQAVIQACGFPLAAPSANPSNFLSPTNPRHVFAGLGDRIPLIVDGGQCQVGIESTVLDLSSVCPRVLRPGMIHEEALISVLGVLGGPESRGGAELRSPGLLPKHYSPRARLLIHSWRDEEELRNFCARVGQPLAGINILAHTKIPSAAGFGRVSVIPHDPEAFARALYAELHACDEAGALAIVVEQPPETPEWTGISDRLKRAAA
jgi:L-threonylcarbamoyladenylate synthase